MKLFLLLFFVVAAGCACALLLAVLRARDRRLLFRWLRRYVHRRIRKEAGDE